MSNTCSWGLHSALKHEELLFPLQLGAGEAWAEESNYHVALMYAANSPVSLHLPDTTCFSLSMAKWDIYKQRMWNEIFVSKSSTELGSSEERIWGKVLSPGSCFSQSCLDTFQKRGEIGFSKTFFSKVLRIIFLLRNNISVGTRNGG